MAASIARSEPIRARWTGCTAVTTPMLRRGDPGQLGDLAADVHAHLEHGGLVLRTEPQQRQRQADLVVLVALASQRREPARRGRPRWPPWWTSWRCSRSRPRRAAGTGAASRRRPRRAPPARRRRGRPSGRRGAAGSGDGPGDQQGGGAPGDRLADERVTVGPLTRQRDEQLARPDQARVDGGAADGSVGAGEQPAAGKAGQVVGAERRQDRPPPAPGSTDRRRSREPVSHRAPSPIRRRRPARRRDPTIRPAGPAS